MATTIEVTKGRAWGFGAILFLIIILLSLAFAATNMLKGDDKKMSEKLDGLVEKVTSTNKTIEGVDGAVKKFPQQLKEAITDHEQRLHQKRKPVHRTVAARKHTPSVVTQRPAQTAQTITVAKAEEVGVPAQAIRECVEKLGGEIVLDGKNIICRPIKPQVVEQRKEEPAPAKITPAPKEDFYDRVVAPSPAPVYRAVEEAPQQQPVKATESSGSSWVPWVLGAGGVLLLVRSLRKSSSPAFVQGGPVNPAPGGPANPLP